MKNTTHRQSLTATAMTVGLLQGCDPNCNMFYHADRIMEGQVGTIDCGRHSIYDTAAMADIAVACVRSAINSETPFRIEANMNFPSGPQLLHLGRRSGGTFELMTVGWNEAGSTRQNVSAMNCLRPGPYRKEAFGPGFLLRYDCPEHNHMGPAPMQPPYTPPQSVPNGALCGVIY